MAVTVSKAPAIGLISSIETRFVILKLMVGAVVGLCLGALVGGVAFGALATDTTATAFLRLQNPADLTAIAGGANQVTPDNQGNTNTFVAGEIAYLSGEGFAQAVGRKMAKDEPAVLNVAQANESSIITISTSSRTDGEAVRTVQVAMELYGQDLQRRVDQELRSILPSLSEWQQRDAADPTRMQDLERIRESVELQAAKAGTLTVVQPPTPNHPTSRQWMIGVILGALVGGSGAVAVVLFLRRRSGRGSLVRTLRDGVDGVLVPAVDLDAVSREPATAERARLARTLYAQCPSAGPVRTVLVLGASSSSGSELVASLLETAVAEARSEEAVPTPSGQHSVTGPAEPTTTRVVAAGAVGDSTLTPELVAAATDIVLVVRIESDTVADVLALRAATAASGAPVVAVFTHRRRRWTAPWSRSSASRTPAPEANAAVPGEGQSPP